MTLGDLGMQLGELFEFFVIEFFAILSRFVRDAILQFAGVFG